MLWCSKVNGVVSLSFLILRLQKLYVLSSATSVIRSSHRVSLIDPDGSRRQQSAFDFVPSLVIIFFTPDKWTSLALR